MLTLSLRRRYGIRFSGSTVSLQMWHLPSSSKILFFAHWSHRAAAQQGSITCNGSLGFEQDENNQISCCVKTYRLICQVFAQRTDQLHGQGWANRPSHVLSSRKTWSATVCCIKLASLVAPWIMWSFIKFSISHHVIILNVNHLDTIFVLVWLLKMTTKTN